MFAPDRLQAQLDEEVRLETLSRIPRISEDLIWLLEFIQGKETHIPNLREIILQESINWSDIDGWTPEIRAVRLMETPGAIRFPLKAAGISIALYIR